MKTILISLIIHILLNSGINTQSIFACDSTWKKILETDASGNIISGRKELLIDGIIHGKQLQVYIPTWSYSASIQNIEVINNKADACAQSIFHVSRDSWESFKTDAFYWFLTFCTTGHVHMTRWFIGTHIQPSSAEAPAETLTLVGVQWFMRSIALGSQLGSPAFCNSPSGLATCGSVQNLEQAVIRGADIRGLFFFGSTYYTALFNNLRSDLSRGMISGQQLWRLGMYENGNHQEFVHDAYWWYSIWSSDGLLDQSSWSVGAHKNISTTSSHVAMNWFVDTCWMSAFQHDKLGKSMSGAVEYLRSSALSGHRVKLVMGNYSVEADNLVIRRNKISAQLLAQSASSDFQTFGSNINWYWQHVATDGTVETVQYDVSDSTPLTMPTSRADVNWYIDTRTWNHVLSTSKRGIATTGSKSNLVTAIRQGSNLRIAIKYSADNISVLQADNVEISPEGNDVGAQMVRLVSYSVHGTPNRVFENKPHRQFIIATTKGEVSYSNWEVGTHQASEVESQYTDIDWFTN